MFVGFLQGKPFMKIVCLGEVPVGHMSWRLSLSPAKHSFVQRHSMKVILKKIDNFNMFLLLVLFRPQVQLPILFSMFGVYIYHICMQSLEGNVMKAICFILGVHFTTSFFSGSCG